MQQSTALTWTAQQVGDWIATGNLGLTEYREVFLRNDIDGSVLASLDLDLMKNELGISSLGHRTKILREIRVLFDPSSINLSSSSERDVPRENQTSTTETTITSTTAVTDVGGGFIEEEGEERWETSARRSRMLGGSGSDRRSRESDKSNLHGSNGSTDQSSDKSELNMSQKAIRKRREERRMRRRLTVLQEEDTSTTTTTEDENQECEVEQDVKEASSEERTSGSGFKWEYSETTPTKNKEKGRSKAAAEGDSSDNELLSCSPYLVDSKQLQKLVRVTKKSVVEEKQQQSGSEGLSSESYKESESESSSTAGEKEKEKGKEKQKEKETEHLTSPSSTQKRLHRSFETLSIVNIAPSLNIPYEELTFGEFLGKGFFGEVRQGLWRQTDVAIKVIYRKSFRNSSEWELFEKEISILSILRHPCIVQFMGVAVGPENCIVTEFMEAGNLSDFVFKKAAAIQKDPFLPLSIILNITKGMQYLHSCNPPVLHRDLSPKNILLDKHFNAKVADFGLSRLQGDEPMTQAVGFLPFQAPEVFKGEKYTKKADVYSFGMVVWFIFSAKNPDYESGSPLKMAHKVAVGYRPPMPDSTPMFWRKLISRCWRQKPKARPSFEKIIHAIQKMQGAEFLGTKERSSNFYSEFGDTTSLSPRKRALHKSLELQDKKKKVKKKKKKEKEDETMEEDNEERKKKKTHKKKKGKLLTSLTSEESGERRTKKKKKAKRKEKESEMGMTVRKRLRCAFCKKKYDEDNNPGGQCSHSGTWHSDLKNDCNKIYCSLNLGLTKELSNLTREHWGCCFSFDKDCKVCVRSGPHAVDEEERKESDYSIQSLIEESVVAKTILQHAPSMEDLSSLNSSLSSFFLRTTSAAINKNG